jgi:mutator protein MutT
MHCEANRHFRVASAIIEKEGRYLITQRRCLGPLAGLWEFPEGKVNPGETDDVALKRVVLERVGVDVTIGRWRAHRVHHYMLYSVDLVSYEASILSGQEPRALRVADFRWVTPQELELYPFPSADQAIADLLLGIGQGHLEGTGAREASLREVSLPGEHG